MGQLTRTDVQGDVCGREYYICNAVFVDHYSKSCMAKFSFIESAIGCIFTTAKLLLFFEPPKTLTLFYGLIIFLSSYRSLFPHLSPCRRHSHREASPSLNPPPSSVPLSPRRAAALTSHPSPRLRRHHFTTTFFPSMIYTPLAGGAARRRPERSKM